jgi:thiol-disulfide isomerase/thioredoxin
MTTLTFQGVMKHYISIQPRGLYFGQVNEGSVATRSLTLTNNMDQPLRLTIPEGQQSETYTWELLDQEPGKVFELKVTAGPAYPDKTTKLNLRLDTNIPEWPKVEVLCLATVRERLEVQPAAITVFTGQGSESRRRIRLVDNGEAPVKVLSADPPADSGITTEIRGLATGKGYDIDLAIPAAYEPPEEGDRLVIRTDDKDKPELYVPIQAIPKQPSAERPPAPALELVGRPAPKATFKTYDNHEMTIGPGSEKVQLVMFYHSWCGFCKQSLPRVNAMWKQYESKGVEVVAVNLDSPQGRIPRTTEQVLDQYREFQLSLPMTLDRAGNIGRQYKVGPVPVFFLIGKSGVVEAFHSGAGAVRGNTLHEEIDLLLEGKTRADFPKSG